MAIDIVARVRKLLELAANNNSPEEAAQATARAQELMFKYSIGEADLEVIETEREAEPVENNIIHDEGKKRDVWKSSLATVLANAFGCKCYFSTEGGFRLHVVGIRSATQTVAYLFGYIQLEIGRLSDEAWKAHKSETKQSVKTWKNSFRLGAVNTISNRLAEQTRAQNAVIVEIKRKAAGGQTPGLSLYQADQERVETEYKTLRQKLGLRSVRSRQRTNMSAYSRGADAGSGLSLGGGRGLGASKTRLEG